jgi:hypothetical protein
MPRKSRVILNARYCSLVPLSRNGQKVVAVCDCGRVGEFYVYNLVSGATKSCGCRRSLCAKHGAVISRHSPTFTSWTCMMDRCYYPGDKSFFRYGGRGIAVCDRWHTYLNFAADMGDRPKGTTLDRMSSNGNYEPSNCRWSDQRTQQNNRRNNHFIERGGVRKSVREWSRIVGLNPQTIHERIKRGWPESELFTPTRRTLTP